MRQEAQANRFAVELLAPAKRFAPFLRQSIDLEAVIALALARDLQISKEATARRLVDLYPDPAAIAFQKNGVLRYWIANEGFRQRCCAVGRNCRCSRINRQAVH